MSQMTCRERVLTALDRQPPDQVPFEISFGAFTPELMETFVRKTGALDPAAYWDFPVRTIHLRHEPSYEFWRRYAPYHPAAFPPGAVISPFGTVYYLGSMKHFEKALHPLKNAAAEDEVAAYPLPDPTEPACFAHLKNCAAQLHAADLAVSGQLYCTIFETAWAIRGFEELMTDLMANPGMVEVLFDRLTEIRMAQARQYAEAGVDVIALGDDIATQQGLMMSLPVWEHWLKPRLARIIAAAREVNPDIHIFYHSDGNCRDAIPGLIDIGVTVLNPVQPECMDPAEIKAEFGDRLAFWGTIGTQTTMPFGTPDDVRAIVRKRIETVGNGGGLLLAPTHILEPEVPWDNIVAFIEAVKSYGCE